MFIKFKKYMKNVKSNMISDLQGYKNIVNMLELWPLDFQKYVEMLKDTKSNELTNMLKEALGDLTKYDIKSAKERLKKHIGMLNTQIYICDSQIRAFDNEKAIGAIEDFPLFFVTLLSIIGKNYLTNKEAIKIFGSAISFKGKKNGENKTPEDLWKCDFESLRPLSNYFDIYGNFQNGGDAELFMILFNQLSKATRLKELGINNDELKLIKYTSLSNKLMIELRSSYEEYLKTAVKREIKPEIKKEKKSEVRKEALEPVIVETEKLSFLTNEDKEIYRINSSGAGEWERVLTNGVIPDDKAENVSVGYEYVWIQGVPVTTGRSKSSTYYRAILDGFQGKSVYALAGSSTGTGVDITNAETKVSAFPNPFTDFVRVDVSAFIAEPAQVALYDMKGNLVMSRMEQLQEGQNRITLNTSSLNNGVYILKVISEHSKAIIKLVK